jgi:RNA polymerase sigma-70 factor (ECF subfamily)
VNIPLRPGSNSESVTPPRSLDEVETQHLLRRCVEGAPDAWRELHRVYHPMVRRVALAMGVGRDELPDYCQEVFVQVFRYLERFKGDAAFKTWLYQICLSQIGRLRRRRRFVTALETIFRVTPPAAGLPSGPPLSEAGVREAERAIAALKPHLREAFVMYEIEGLDGAEIAAVLRCPPGTVRRRLHQARQEIEAALGIDGGGRRHT